MVPSPAKEYAMTQAYTHRFTEVHEAPAALFVPPQAFSSLAGDFLLTPFVNMAYHQRAVFTLATGEMPATSVIVLTLVQAKDINGTDWKPFIGPGGFEKVIWAWRWAAWDDRNELSAIELKTEEMDVNNGYCWVGLLIEYETVIGGDIDASVLSFLGGSNSPPVATPAWNMIED